MKILRAQPKADGIYWARKALSDDYRYVVFIKHGHVTHILDSYNMWNACMVEGISEDELYFGPEITAPEPCEHSKDISDWE